MAERKFKGHTITDALPKKGDLTICINKKHINYGTTAIVTSEFIDTKNWKVVVQKKPLRGLERYPEFTELVTKITNETCKKINAEAVKIKSEMRYREQFVLEEVIQALTERI